MDRKDQERYFHDELGLEAGEEDELGLGPSRRFYSVTRRSRQRLRDWLASRCPGRVALDYGCGNGTLSLAMARQGAGAVVGIDLSDVLIANCRRRADAEGMSNVKFLVMDCESMAFEDSTFDVIAAVSVLHHLELEKAYRELSRVLKPHGEVICLEPLKHNPLIQWYRRRTPSLRTPWEVEHILCRRDIFRARKYFSRVKVLEFCHLASLAAVPLRHWRVFWAVVSLLESLDSLLFRIPGIGWLAWQVMFVLSEPKK